MLRPLIFFMLGLLFQGCEFYRSAMYPDMTRERYIQATRKGEILADLQTEAVILATHLNEAYPDRFDSKLGTYFFVDIYISTDSIDVEKRGLFNPLYSIALSDSITPISIKQLDHDEIIAYQFDYKSPWGQYFLVQFPPQPNKKTLQLVIKREGLEKSILTFTPSSSSTIFNRL